MDEERFTKTEAGEFSIPQSSEDLEVFIHDRLSDRLKPVDINEVSSQSLHWRGLDPADALPLLTGSKEAIQLRSEMPNTTKDWQKAISYGRGETKYQLALGFMPEDDWQVKPAMTHVTEDMQQLPNVLQYQRGNFIVNGDIHPQSVRYLIIRPHGSKPGQVGESQYFRIENLPKAA